MKRLGFLVLSFLPLIAMHTSNGPSVPRALPTLASFAVSRLSKTDNRLENIPSEVQEKVKSFNYYRNIASPLQKKGTIKDLHSWGFPFAACLKKDGQELDLSNLRITSLHGLNTVYSDAQAKKVTTLYLDKNRSLAEIPNEALAQFLKIELVYARNVSQELSKKLRQYFQNKTVFLVYE